jgi:Trm5-related predicted tRNA methylase
LSHRKIGDEKGAREISKWLGISWKELVAQAKEKKKVAGSSDE